MGCTLAGPPLGQSPAAFLEFHLGARPPASISTERRQASPPALWSVCSRLSPHTAGQGPNGGLWLLDSCLHSASQGGPSPIPGPSPRCPDLCPGASSSAPLPAWPPPAPLPWSCASDGPPEGLGSLRGRPALFTERHPWSPARGLAPCSPAALPRAHDGSQAGPHGGVPARGLGEAPNQGGGAPKNDVRRIRATVPASGRAEEGAAVFPSVGLKAAAAPGWEWPPGPGDSRVSCLPSSPAAQQSSACPPRASAPGASGRAGSGSGHSVLPAGIPH